MSKLKMTFACGPYDRMEALQYKRIDVEGIDLTYLEIQAPREIFDRVRIKNGTSGGEMVVYDSFDGGEMQHPKSMMNVTPQVPFPGKEGPGKDGNGEAREDA